ncbi:MAG: acyloxyacyl hydrolase [Phycisphaeraceae bacterium]
MRCAAWLVAVGVIMTVAVSTASAQDEELNLRPDPSPAGLIPPTNDPFAKGTWQVSLYGGAIRESFGRGNETIAFGAAGIEYFVFDDFSFMFEPIGYSVSQNEVSDTYGGGLNIGFRHHLLKFDESRIAIYWEGLVGYAHFNDRTPGPDGTHSNFTIWTGPGVKWRVVDNLSLIGGMRYFHLSNARRRGKSRNPSIDGFGGYGGFTLHF